MKLRVRSESLTLWWAVVGIMALALAGCTGRITRDTTASLLAREGPVVIDESPAEIGARLHKGGTLRTGDESTAALMLLPGALVQLGPNSALRVEALSITKNGNATDEAMSRMVRIRLLEGTIDIVVQSESPPGSWSVETAHGTVSALQPGTGQFSVTPGRLRIVCLRGRFGFSPVGTRAVLSIEGGYFQEWPAANSEPCAVDLDARAQAEIEQSLGVERKLLALQNRERHSPFPWRRFRN